MDLVTTNRNIMLNFLKGLACIGVVFIHVKFPGKVGDIVKCASAYAVPVFFLIAGYFAFGKNEDVIKRRLFKVIKIFIFGYLVFFLLKALVAFNNHELLNWLASNYTIKSLFKSVIFCTIGFATPLWYLIAQIETYIFWLFIVKFNKENMMVKWIPILFVLQVTTTIFCETMKFDWFWKMNFVTKSLSWFVLGYYMHSIPKERIKKLSSSKVMMVALVGLVIIIIPVYFNLKLRFSSLGYIFYATALFVMALKYAQKSFCKPLEYLGDKLSLWVYIFHVPTGYVVKMFVKRFFGIDTETGVYTWIHPVITLCAVILISYIFHLILTRIFCVKRSKT